MRRKRLRQHRPTMSIEVHYVSYKDYLFLQDMIDNPPEPNEKLMKLFNEIVSKHRNTFTALKEYDNESK